MEGTKLPKCVMFGELVGGAGCVGGQENGWVYCHNLALWSSKFCPGDMPEDIFNKAHLPLWLHFPLQEQYVIK